MDLARLLRRTLAEARGGRLGDVSAMELAEALQAAYGAIPVTLPGGLVPSRAERQHLAVSIQPPWQLVGPDGRRHKLVDVLFDLAAVHKWLAKSPAKPAAGKRHDWSARLKAAKGITAKDKRLSAVLEWAKPLYRGGNNPGRDELLTRHRKEFGPIRGISEPIMRDARRTLATDVAKHGGRPRLTRQTWKDSW